MSTIRGRAGLVVYLTGTGLSMLGNAMAVIALPWFVLRTTGSAAQTGWVSVATALPMFLSGLLGGPLIDRMGGRRMSVLADVVSGVAVLAIPLCYRVGALTFPMLLALVFLGAMLDVPGLTARRTLLPELSETAGVTTDATYSWFEMLTGITGILGPAVAGIIIGAMGPLSLLWINGLSFFASAASVAAASVSKPAHAATSSPASYLEEVHEGLRFLFRDRLQLSIAWLFAVTNAIKLAIWSVGMPVLFFRHHGSATRLGVILSVIGVGSIASAAVWGMCGSRLRSHRRAVMIWEFVLSAACYVWLAFSPSYPVLLTLAVLIGISNGPIAPLTVALRIERTPPRLRGRVLASFGALTALATPLGPAIMGQAVDHIGIRGAMWSCAGLYVAFVAATPFFTSWREMDEPESSV